MAPDTRNNHHHPHQGPGAICVGLSRTGTKSLMLALNDTDSGQGPAWHMFTLFDQDIPTQIRLMLKWIEIGKLYQRDPKGTKMKRQELLKEALQGYNSFLDVPTIVYFEDLMEMFPDKKVVLTMRNSPEEWFSSIEKTIVSFTHASPTQDFGVWLFLKLNPMGILVDAFHRESWRFIMPRGDSKEEFIQMYNDWNDRIQRTVPAERLVMLRVNDGWETLARGVGFPVPQKPFPKSNDAADIDKSFVPVRILGFLTLMLYLFVAYRVFKCVRGGNLHGVTKTKEKSS